MPVVGHGQDCRCASFAPPRRLMMTKHGWKACWIGSGGSQGRGTKTDCRVPEKRAQLLTIPSFSQLLLLLLSSSSLLVLLLRFTLLLYRQYSPPLYRPLDPRQPIRLFRAGPTKKKKVLDQQATDERYSNFLPSIFTLRLVGNAIYQRVIQPLRRSTTHNNGGKKIEFPLSPTNSRYRANIRRCRIC